MSYLRKKHKRHCEEARALAQAWQTQAKRRAFLLCQEVATPLAVASNDGLLFLKLAMTSYVKRLLAMMVVFTVICCSTFHISTIFAGPLAPPKQESASNENAISSERIRLLISKLTDDDYTHVGGEAVLDIIVNKVKEFDKSLLQKPTLEIGSSYGAAINYLHKCFAKLWGLESNKEAVEYARNNYPQIIFEVGTVLKVTSVFKDEFFSLIYMLNSAGTVLDTGLLLQKLREVTEPRGIFIISDYSYFQKDILPKIKRPDNKLIYPFNSKKIEMLVKLLEMEVIAVKDITREYCAYHQMLVDRLAARKADLISCNEFTEKEIALAEEYYQKILDLLKDGSLGGVMIFIRNGGK